MASDPLALLRLSISDSRPAELLTASSEPTATLSEAASLRFPQSAGEPVVVTKDAPTRYARSDARTEFYSVGQLWVVWEKRDASLKDFMQSFTALGVGNVPIADRRAVQAYLAGESDGGVRVGESKAPVPEAGPSRVAAPKRKYEVNAADLDFCKKLRAEEIELRDRNTVLRVSGTGKVNNFEQFVKGMMSEKIRALRKSFDGRSAAPVPAAAPVDVNRSRKHKQSHPIIMISSSPTSLITMWNVKKFLEEGIFEPSDVARANEMSEGNMHMADIVRVLRKRQGPTGETTTEYRVVDSVDGLQKCGQEPWDRVICVVTTGQAWQFKPYKWVDPRMLFRHVKGIYFQWHNESANPTVRDWNVTEMRIDRSRRHTDRQVVAEFWRNLDTFRRR
ncbi:hypothetical protein CspeluHIS016_0404140 [Cutaneotrichosporon spelunceum]|uniref:Cell division control protein 73 C-terminal domain-containing protein n=1 Tax=Cutaneotrichosporon spelunceum TaxID=1672016 RepID=A0AAD3TW61_9TREE|nr:hypothetical protein CspeluHIS016_0404140 [Cutaneotrichosporon spelunceum]